MEDGKYWRGGGMPERVGARGAVSPPAHSAEAHEIWFLTLV